VDFEQEKKDVRPFIKNLESLTLWSKEFFIAITEDRLIIDAQ
jgi:hypothetical protein